MIDLTTKKYKVSEMYEASSLPSVSHAINVQNTTKALIDDYDGLFIGYGKRDNCYPYREQNNYGSPVIKDLDVVVLENDYLYAEFLPTLGGRLWRLTNKITKQDLLYHNDVIMFRNLSIRNAWFSGGVEWNIGIIGHTPYTCDNLYCAKVTGDNGEEVLRFYEFERVREVYYQIDFWLDKDKLYNRVCIHNTNNKVVPMYWWSNIATPEFKGGRVIVPASSAYNNSDGIGISKSRIPFDKGADVSYPENITDTIDYFYDIPQSSPKFIANVDSNGKGLLQYSSSMLKGRKLFSWGHVQGSYHWQQYLTENAGDYVEIQAGLGKTQYECIPMPPKTTWSFVECYTDILLDLPIDSDYNMLVNNVSTKFDSAKMEDLCDKTYATITTKKGEIVYYGKGYGYLNNLLNNNCPTHLEFAPCKETEKWIALHNSGTLQNLTETDSFLIGDSAKTMLRNALQANSTNWLICYQLALIEYDNNKLDTALDYVIKSIVLNSNYQNMHLYMTLLQHNGNMDYLYFADKIIAEKPSNYAVAESIFKLFLEAKQYDKLVTLYDRLSDNVKDNCRIKLYLAVAYSHLNEYKLAENIILNSSFDIVDYREGDKMLNKLYKDIRVKLYGEAEKDVIVPYNLDFVVVQ